MMVRWVTRLVPVVAVLVSTGCSSSGIEARPSSRVRPAHCALQEVGSFYIRANHRYESLRSRLSAYGFDATRDVRTDTRLVEVSPGNHQTVVVGWEGVGLRWNDPICRRR
jgi:hypothetical protein